MHAKLMPSYDLDRVAQTRTIRHGGNAARIRDGVAHAPRVPPRPDRWRRALPDVHREVAQWLRHQAVCWWVTTDRFMELCSLRI
jgi:hypothetical protein